MYHIQKNAFYLLLFLFLACSDWDLERVDFLEIITVGAAEIESNGAILLGDLVNLREPTTAELGFLVSSEQIDRENFQIGNSALSKYVAEEQTEITEVRAFLVSAENLESSKSYFFRAYALLSDNTPAYGMIDSFTTTGLSISLESLDRTFGGCPTSAVIQLQIASTGIDLVSVEYGVAWHNDLFNEPDVNDQIVLGTDIQDGLATILLPVDCNQSYRFRPFLRLSENEIFYDKSYEFTSEPGGAWIFIGEIPQSFNVGQIEAFSAGSNGYLIGNVKGSFDSEMWMYETSIQRWSLIDDPGEFITQGFWVLKSNDRTIAGESFTGLYEFKVEKNQWEFLGTNDGVAGLNKKTGFFINNRIYFGGEGAWRSINLDDLNTFSTLNPYPGSSGTITFLIGNRGYRGFEVKPDGTGMRMWRFAFNTSDWIPSTDIPESFFSVSAFSMNGRGYVLSRDDSDGNPDPSFWEYDPDLEEWKKLADFGRGEGNASFGFAIDGVAYAGLERLSRTEATREFWKYVPEL